MRIPIRTYHYVPPGGVPAQPITIYAMQEYSPNKHDSDADTYLFKIPNELRADLPQETETQTWGGVLRALASWFEGETEEGANSRLILIDRDPVSHRGL